MRKMRAGTYILDEECHILDLQEGTVADTEEETKLKQNEKNCNCSYALWFYMSLFLGIIFLIVSLTWLIHM